MRHLRSCKAAALAGALVFVLAGSALAQDGLAVQAPGVEGPGQITNVTPPPASQISAGDTAWVLICSAMVLLMTPGLAFFYGGLVRRKNILSVLMQCFMAMCLVSVQWVALGYSLSFGDDHHGIIGGISFLGLKGVDGSASAYATTIPQSAFAIFQMMFAIITPALIIGAFAERMRFSAFCVFSLLWATLVYDPVAHWVWGAGGFLGAVPDAQGHVGWGVRDFAGGLVVHVNAGAAALAGALVMGKRIGYPDKTTPHNLPIAALGAGLLWFGWFGFNAGSALGANALACSTFLATNTAGAIGGLAWSLLDWIKHGKPTTLGMITGAVAGLAAVTPASGYVDVAGAMWIGAGAGIICWYTVTFLKTKLGYDDSLDAFGVHGVGGVWGTLALGIWAVPYINGQTGLMSGQADLLWVQFLGVLVVGTYSFVASFILFKIVNLLFKVRVDEHEERVGLDLTQHKESGYTVID